jgi:Ribosome inactivating protein
MICAFSRRARYGFSAAIVTLVVTVAMFISGVVPAVAETTPWSVSHVWMNLGGGPSWSQQSQYQGLINSLRNAAGYGWRDNVMQTQTDSNHSLIRLDLSYTDSNGTTTNLWLWFEPDNLYLRGFTTNNGTTYSFNDYNLQAAMQPASAITFNNLLPSAAWGGAYNTLPFGSDYNDMTQAAHRNRSDMPLSWSDMWNSFYNLAYAETSGNQSLARSLMFMIQFTSEAARFNDVYGVMADILRPGSNGTQVSYDGLPSRQQELENSWAQISQYAVNLTNSNPSPLYVGPYAGTLYGWAAVQAVLAQRVGNLNGAVVSPTGNWWKTEL